MSQIEHEEEDEFKIPPRKIKKHGEIRGKKLTKKQEGFFGLLAGGKTPTRIKPHNEHLAERMIT